MKILRTAAVFVLACSISSLAFASAREQMNAFTKGVNGLESRFQQQVFDGNGRQTEKSAGTVKLSAPRQFRWEYQTPSPQLIVADGDHIWIYDPDLQQVTVRNQSFEEQSSPLAVLIDPTELDRQFKVSEGGTAEGMDWLLLAPKKTDDAPFVKAKLGFGPTGLIRMELDDALGQHTVIAFSGWNRNPKFAKGDFAFTPPKGADVVGDTSEGAEVLPLHN
ncbi:MAG TPA: outer membrane lipoprotein chaperone LolA [Luteimonas sp.]|nr:outer membrane lipoprotein chaperone LolA [Luteimonas sp.]